MKTLIAIILILVGAVGSYAASDTVKYTTRSNNGPEKDYVVTDGVRWSVNAAGTLTVTAIYDSTAQGILFMEMVMPGFSARSVGNFSLKSSTTWKYGHNTGQVVICQSGSITISEIDSVTDRMNATFQWTGKATLPNGVILNSTISKGSFSIVRTPKIANSIVPKNGVKWRPAEKVKLTVITTKTGSQRAVAGVKVKLDLPPGIFETIGLESISDASGTAQWNLKLKGDADSGKYNIIVLSTKEGFDDSKQDTFKFVVDSTQRYYYGKCGGVPFVEFDAGEGEKWKDGGGNVITSSGEIILNRLLKVKGRVDIDTTGGGSKFSFDGELSIPAVYYEGSFHDLVFYRGSLSLPSMGCDALLDLAAVPVINQLAGSNLKELKIRLLGDFANSAGASISVGVEGPRNMATGCNDALPFGTVFAPNKREAFTGEIKVLDSLGKWYLSFSAKASNMTMGPSLCVKELSVSYDAPTSELTVAGKIKSPLFEELGGSISIKDGDLNKFAANFRFDGCTPIPETPACFKGGSISAENLKDVNPFKFQIASIFQVYGTPDLLELELQGGLEAPPAKIRATGILRVLNVPAVLATKPWQIEGSGSRMFDIDNYALTDSGSLKAVHLGGEYFFDGKYALKIGLKPEFFMSIAASASSQIPAMEAAKAASMGWFARWVNGYAPVPIGKTDLSMMITVDGERTLSANVDFRNAGGTLLPQIRDIIRAVGKGSIFVDFNKLPSATAVVLEGNFESIYNAVFGAVQDVSPGKPTEQIQAEQTFTVAPNELTMVAFASTDAAPADLTFRMPNGTAITAADTANGIHRALSLDGKIVMWVIKNPVAGAWTAIQPQGRAGDSLSVNVTRIYPDLDVTATQTGDNLVVSWNAEAYPAGATIAISAIQGPDQTGRYLFAGPANVSPVTIVLTDTSAPCEFTLDAVVAGRGVRETDTADGTFTNTREYLPTPQNVVAITSTITGRTTISWTPITNGFVSGVVVYRVDGGRYEAVSSAQNFESTFEFVMPNPEGAVLKLVSLDAKGRSSCPSAVINVTTDVKELEHQGNGMTMWLAPNPAFDQVSVRTDNVAGDVSYKLVDMMGSIVLAVGAQSERTTLDLTSLSSGTYILVAQVGEKHVASTLHIVR